MVSDNQKVAYVIMASYGVPAKIRFEYRAKTLVIFASDHVFVGINDIQCRRGFIYFAGDFKQSKRGKRVIVIQ